MKKIIRSEWEKLWSQKLAWLCLLSIPILLILSANISLNHNLEVPSHYPEYTYANNFPTISLAEHLIISLNMIVLLLVVLMFAHEYHSGQMRFLLQRVASFKQIIIAKWITILAYVSIFLVLYFVSSYVYGLVKFEYKTTLKLIMHTEYSNHYEVFLYNIMYYLLSLISLMVLVSVLITLSLLSKSTTSAMTLCIGFILLSFTYPYILQLFGESPYLWIFFYSSIIMIQYEGIALILAGNIWVKAILLGILLIYALISSYINLRVLSKNDHFI